MKDYRDDYTQREQHMTCVSCGHPISDNWVMKRAYGQNITVGWAKNNLRILADTAENKGMDWFASEARKIMDGLKMLDA